MKIVFKCKGNKPWGAVVKKLDEGRKLELDFSAAMFKEGKLYIECQPGDTIVVGVGMDFWGGGSIYHKSTLYTVESDGSLKKVAEIVALEYEQPVAE